MEDDDLLLDDWDDEDDSDPIIEYEIDTVTDDYGGHQRTIQRGYFSAGAGVNENSRSYTQVANGVITFGYRDKNSGSRTAKYTLTPMSYYNGSATYYGISCTAEKIKIAQDQTKDNVRLYSNIGGYTVGTGYLQVITNVTVSQENGVFWTVERLPFKNGLCVANR